MTPGQSDWEHAGAAANEIGWLRLAVMEGTKVALGWGDRKELERLLRLAESRKEAPSP